MPSAIKNVRPVAMMEKSSLPLPPGVRPISVAKKEEAEPPSRKEAEKKVKKISHDEMDDVSMLIESDPSKKDVHEYFKQKIDKLNEL